MIVILLVGVLNISQIKRTLFPEIKSTELHITTIYLGGSAEVVERNITRKVERALNALPHIKTSSSISTEALSYVNLRLDANLNQRKLEKLMDKARSAISRISDFPSDLKQKPIIELFNLEDLPIITIGIKKDVDYFSAKKLQNQINRKVKRLSQISNTQIFGQKKPVINISVDPLKLIEQKLTLEEISNILQSRFYSGNLGKLELKEKSKNIILNEKKKLY